MQELQNTEAEQKAALEALQRELKEEEEKTREAEEAVRICDNKCADYDKARREQQEKQEEAMEALARELQQALVDALNPMHALEDLGVGPVPRDFTQGGGKDAPYPECKYGDGVKKSGGAPDSPNAAG